MDYDHENKIIIICYNNTNIDFIKNNNIINVPDVKNKLIVGEKKINNIVIDKGIAYTSTSLNHQHMYLY